MRILIVTDAWKPQVNGVVRSLEAMSQAARRRGAEITFLAPSEFPTVPLPTYGEIRLALASPGAVARRIGDAGAEHVHIATEGPLGIAARSVCIARAAPFTTSYHTRFPEYLHARVRAPLAWTYAALRRFHNAAAGIMAATPRLSAELHARGFQKPMIWSRGVDHELFRPRASRLDLPRPIFLYAGRLAVEKNVEAFLSLDLPGTKVIVGDGPARKALAARYPQARFLGVQTGLALAETYSSADVFVFPSLTDTFGVVLLEAMASGVPVAAYPAAGPIDVVAAGAGVLSNDLREACLAALAIPREAARAHALGFTWDESARQFLANIEIARGRARSAEQRELFRKRQCVET